jgi:hypothetical protein
VEEELLVAIESSVEERDDETIQAYNLRSFDPKPKGANSSQKRDAESTIQFYTQKQSKNRRSRSAAPPASPQRGISTAPEKKPALDNDRYASFGMAPPARSKPLVPLDLESAAEQIRGATNRDEIIELVAKFASQVFEYSLLLVVHGAFAQGRLAMLGNTNEPAVEDISIPLDRGGMFQTVFETRSFHLGPLGITEIEEEALQQMGRKWPKNCAILPVTLRNRVILMIYGDSGEKGVRGGQVSEFVRLTRHISEAFERILLEQKYKGYRAAAGTIPPQPVRSSHVSKPPVSFESYQSAPRGRPSESSPRPQATGAASGSKSKPPADGKHLSDWAGRYHVQGDGHLEDEGEPRRSTKPPRLPRASSAPPGARRSSGSPRRSYPITSPLASGRGPDSGSYANRRDSQPVEPPDDFEEKIVHDVESGAPPPVFERRRGARDEAEKASFAREVRDIPRSQPPAPSRVRERRFSSAATTEKPRSVMVEMKEEIDRAVARILSARRYDEEAADLLVGIGDDALKELIAHFPGPLLCDRYQETGSLPPVTEHGPLLKTLVKFGKKVVPHVLPLFESLDSDVRFYATFLFSELRYPEALSALTARIFDNDRQVRAMAIEVMQQYRDYSEYNWSMRELISALESAHASLDTKRIAATAIGDLREASAVGALIRALGASDAMLVDRCQKALVKITLADFGFSERRWEFWWDVHREQHRIEWAIEAMTHGKAQIRNAAFQELVTYAGTAIAWPSKEPNPRQCQQLQDQLLEWWKREGRTLYPK